MSVVDHKILCVARGRVKASITKLQKFAEEINANVSLVEINAKLVRLSELTGEFIKYDDVLASETGYEAEFDKYEDKIDAIQTKLLIEKESRSVDGGGHNNDVKNDPDMMAVLNQLAENQKLLTNSSKTTKLDTHLPKIQIKPFSGEYKDWPTFKDQFEKLVHEDIRLSEIQKFTHLRQFLAPEPLLLIQNLLVTKENYENAWNKLLKRYDNKRKIANSYVDEFFNQKPVKDGNAEEIRRISDNVENILSGLDGIDPTANGRDIWLIHILLSKLDATTKRLWAEKSIEKYEKDINEGKIFPKINDFLNFLDDRRSALESIQEQSLNKKSDVSIQNKVKSHVVNGNTCPICDNPHPLRKCFKFKKLTVQERRDSVSKFNLCFNCMSPNHKANNCKSEKKCSHCSKNHHSMLHLGNNNVATQESKQEAKANTSSSTGTVSTNEVCNFNNNGELRFGNGPPQFTPFMPSNNNVQSHTSYVFKSSGEFKTSGFSMLPTAEVEIGQVDGNIEVNGKILLDSGSQVSFVTERLVQTLKLKRQKTQVTVSGLSSTGSVAARGVVHVKLKSCYDNSTIMVKAYVLTTISDKLPSKFIDIKNWSCLKGLNLADKSFNIPSKVDMLLGSDYFFNILRDGKIVGINGCPSLINTMFGWIVGGIVDSEKCAPYSFTTIINDNSNLDELITRFWEIENVKSDLINLSQSEEEQFCENNFVDNLKINADGKFVVSLPFKTNHEALGDSLQSATKRLKSLDSRLSKHPEYNCQYKSFMEEYIQLGHMKIIPKHEIEVSCQKSYYLAHHAVVKPDSLTTKCRVVFDGSNKTTAGVSLNDVLAVGPKIQRDLQAILLNFRWHKIALCGDIEKMYRQVLITEEHQDYQRIIWHDNPQDEIKHYRLCTVTYGTASAPFLAVRCLNEIGKSCSASHSSASKAIINDFYVDDFTSGADSEEEAVQLQNDVSTILEKYGFPIRKWSSNSQQVLKSMSQDKLANSLMALGDNKESIKILGLQWQSKQDFFTFKVKIIQSSQCTKRTILSEASRVFDPLGFLSPSIILFKIMFQELWLKKYDWDEVLPPEISSKWFNLRNNLHELENLQIPRWIFTPSHQIELIGFCDASERAYSAVIYVKVTDLNFKVQVNLLTSKTKVTPLKKISIPRLELCGAWLLTKLYQFVVTTLSLQSVPITAFTDSSVVLSWLAAHPSRWKPFVAFKTSQIIEVLPVSKWRHVSSKSNPADCASRGISPEALIKHQSWWHGPEWLVKPTLEWPSSSLKPDGNLIENESRKKSILSLHVVSKNCLITNLFNNISSLAEILRILSYCSRMFRKQDKPSFITSEELENSLRICIRWSQGDQFSDEINSLQSNEEIKRSSSLRNLQPFLDRFSILRIRGRISNLDCSYDTKHPYIIPKNHVLSKMIIHQLHIKHLHAGPTLLMNIIRQKFWILGLRHMVKRESKGCIICERYRASTCQQLMADLPIQRILPSRPFLHTGVDYAGPFIIKWHKGRGTKTDKAYLALFVCFSTKAAHLEVVSDMTTDGFIAALRRFIGRRGTPDTMYSDHGSNFIGAKRVLSSLYQLAFKNEKLIGEFLANNSIKWKMIPPAAPHQGGIWESCVRSAKIHLKKVMGDHIMTFEELSTLFVQIEAQLNSRPLTPVYDNDPDNLDVLTPGHFLIGSALTSLPDDSLLNTRVPIRDKWRVLTKIQQDFWARWRRDYLNTLQSRKKWQVEKDNLKEGDMVLVKDNNLPPTYWGLGRIKEVHKGSDGLVRAVTIKTSKAVLSRPITKIVKLPVDG